VDTQQNFQSREDLDKLRLKNEELKKELEREQLLHKMLYNEWKQLSDQASARENEIYDSGRPKNLFYKYAFYVLLVGGAAAFYFLYYGGSLYPDDNKTSASSPAVSIPVIHSDSVTTTTALVKDSLLKNEPAISTNTAKQNNDDVPKQVILKQPEVKQPEIKPVEKNAITPDTAKRAIATISKPVVEPPLTAEARDSIYWLGFNAYFNHSPNHYKKSSAKYKAWLDGFNNGKAEAKKVAPKDLP
jgi:hypothetical protein